MKSIKCIIPARSGSLRVKNKNLAPFGGSCLLEIKIRQMLRIGGIAEVVVSSNDPAMLDLAASLGAVAIPRDPYYASNEVPMSEVYAYMAGQVDADDLLVTHVTNPLVKDQSYEEAIRLYLDNASSHDSLTTVADVKEFLYQDGKPLNFDPACKPRSQDLPDIVSLTHAISILPRDMMIAKKSIIGESPLLMRLSQEESYDIDTPFDFEIAELLWCRSNRKAEV